MRNIPKMLSSSSSPHRKPTTHRQFETHPSYFSSRSKSSKKRHSLKTSPSKTPHPRHSPPSLFQRISEVLVTEDPAFSFSKGSTNFTKSVTQVGTSTACQIAPKSPTLAKSYKFECEKLEPKETHVENSNPEDVSPIVHQVTEILRSENTEIPVEERLADMDVSFSSEIVEKVLKRCFKVGHLAFWFFTWARLRPGFSHTTESYNTMIYIAGENEDFDLVEKLACEMDSLGLKNIKTWTILISHYGKAKKIGRALSTLEEIRRSGCELDRGVYEAILRALVTAGKTELAMEFYKEMVGKNIGIDDMNLYGLLLNCLCRSGDLATVRAVGDDMMKIMKVPEIEIYTLILRSFCISGKINEADQLLEEAKKKNVAIDSRVYGVLLKGLCIAGRMDEAIDVLDKMKLKSTIGRHIYGYLIDGFLRKGDISKALEILQSMKELKCLPTVSSYTEIIQHLFRSDNYEKACKLYEEMIADGIEPDIVAITAMVAGHVQNYCISEAWKLFETMKKKKGTGPTWKAYVGFIKELCKASIPDEAMKLLNEMESSNLNATDDIYALVSSTLKRVGKIEKTNIVKERCKSFKLGSCLEGKRLYQKLDDQFIHKDHEVSKSTQTRKEYSDSDLKELCRILSSSISDWSLIEEVLERSTIDFTPELVAAVLNRCQSYGHAALDFFSWVRNKPSYRHTTETYSSAIKISGSAKDFRYMRKLFQEMRRSGCSVTPNTWTIMISQYGRVGLTEIALKTFKEMKYKGYQPNASTYKYLIVFLCGKKGRKLEEAMKIFHEMMHAGFMPDRETLEIYLSSLCELGKLADTRSCVKTLFKKGFTKQLGYSLLVKSLCRAGEIEQVLEVIKEMEENGCTIDQFIYGSIVHALLRGRRLDDALNQVEAMKKAGISQSVHIQTSFIVHFCKEKQIEKAIEVLRKMREEDGIEPTLVTYSAMIRGYMNMGMVSDAWGVFRRLKVEGPSPDFETYSMFISCLCRGGKSEDGLQLIREMLERGIIPSALNFRTVFHGLNREGKQDLAHAVLQTKWKLKRQRMAYN